MSKAPAITVKLNSKHPKLYLSILTVMGRRYINNNITSNREQPMFPMITKMQEILLQALITSSGISEVNGSIALMVNYITARIKHIASINTEIKDIKFINAIFGKTDIATRHPFVFKIDTVKDTVFVLDYGHYGALIYQIEKGEIVNIFQCDWDVENPADPDSWLSLLTGRGIPSVGLLQEYLRGHDQPRLPLTDITFLNSNVKTISNLLIGDVSVHLKTYLGFYENSLNISSGGLSRISAISSDMYSNIAGVYIESFKLLDIFKALRSMHTDNAPFMTEAAFFEQWAVREQFSRLDTIIYGYKPNTLGYVIKLKDQDEYLFIEINTTGAIGVFCVLPHSTDMYVEVPRLNITSPENISLFTTLEFEGFNDE